MVKKGKKTEEHIEEIEISKKSGGKKGTDTTSDLEQQVIDLQKKLADQEEVTKRAQSDYFRTKMEFDEYITRAEAAKKGFELDGLVKALEKVVPFVNQLGQTAALMPEELAGNAWAEGVQLIYSKAITDLDLLGVSPVKVAIGTDPDYTIHIPIGMEETDDESLKNKIVKEVEGGFEYNKGETKKVILPAKVLVGS